MRLTKNSTIGRRKFNLATASSSKSRSNSKKQKPTSKAPVPVHHQCCTADDGGRRWQFVRRDGEEVTARKAYEDFGPPSFLVHVLYGGSFVQGDGEGFHNMKYVGGVCDTLHNFNLQLHFLSDLEGFGAALLKTREFNMFYVGYHRPYQCDSWKLLKNNDRLEELFNMVDGISNCVWVYMATYDFMSWLESEELLIGMEEEERDNYDVPYLLQESDPDGSIVIDLWPMDERDPESRPKFHRMYVCLGACKKGFKAGCRQVVGLDGTHLKGVTKGQLLTAVGIDANNQMFVIAYAAVDAEIYDNWIWFLELLRKDLEINNSHGWCFMTDKQKGLLDAVGELFPNVEHGNCMKHLASNFIKANPGIEGRGLLWAASKSNNVPLYNWVMEKLKKDDNKGYLWLQDKPPQSWSRAHFNTFTQCHIITNNMCEAFNKVIRKGRGKPVISMFEHLREYLMEYMQRKRLEIEKYDNTICPNIQKKLEKKKLLCGDYRVQWSGEGLFQVKVGEREQCGVEINDRTCTCRYWDLTGVPCEHAIACIYTRALRPEDFVAKCYLTETQKAIYKYLVYPINGVDMWPNSNNIPPEPPLFRRQAGRPKKNRNKDRFEKEDERKAQNVIKPRGIVMCGRCGQYGHNKRKCPNEPDPKRIAFEENKRKYLHKGESSGTAKGKKQMKKSTPSNSATNRTHSDAGQVNDAGQVRKGVKRATPTPSLQLPPLHPQSKGKGKVDGQVQPKKKMMKTSWPLNVTSNSSTTPLGDASKSKLIPRRSAKETVKIGASLCQTDETRTQASMSQPLPRRSPRKLPKVNVDNRGKDVSTRSTQ